MQYVNNPNAPVPKCLHSLDAAPYMWDDTLGRWRIDPNALKAANSIWIGVSTASGTSTSLASRGAAEPKTTTASAPAELVSSSASVFAPAKLVSSSASAT